MPTVVVEGQFRFVVHTRENSFEPPHVHVRVAYPDVCRMELNGGLAWTRLRLEPSETT